jgi:hypothetical protein
LRDDNEAALAVRDKFWEVSAFEWAIIPALLLVKLLLYSHLQDLALATSSLLVLVPRQHLSSYVAALLQTMVVHHSRHGS